VRPEVFDLDFHHFDDAGVRFASRPVASLASFITRRPFLQWHCPLQARGRPHYDFIEALRECKRLPPHTSPGQTLVVDLGSYLHPSTAFRSLAASISTEKSFLDVNSNRSRSSRKTCSAIAGNS